MKKMISHWPLLLALGVLYATMYKVVLAAVACCEGNLIYALDDPYIHMAIGKNLAQHGTWGVTPYGFTSSASSLIWPIMIAAVFKVAGCIDSVLLVLNLVSATLLLCVIYMIWRQHSVQSWIACAGLICVTFLTPMPTIIMTGLEHAYHSAITILAMSVAASVLSSPNQKRSLTSFAVLCLLLPMVTMARYEGLFLVFAVALLVVVRKGVFSGALVCGSGALPAIIYGLVSHAHGWSFLPNSVLLKARPIPSSLRGTEYALGMFVTQMVQYPHLLMLALWAAALFAVLYITQRTVWRSATVLLLLFLIMLGMHVLLAAAGYFYRYEAYLVASGIFVLVVAATHLLPDIARASAGIGVVPRFLTAALVLAVSAMPLAGRALTAYTSTPIASGNIYGENYQMAQFFREYYDGEWVAANDIGAINYYGRIHCLDLWGLASMDIAEVRRRGRADSQGISEAAHKHGVKVAIAYDAWFDQIGGLPKTWTRVGQWTIRNNVVCGEDHVSIYAVDPSETQTLIENLRAFSESMPASVIQSGPYCQ